MRSTGGETIASIDPATNSPAERVSNRRNGRLRPDLVLVGVLLYGIADLRLGGWLALAGLVLGMASTLAAQIWIRTHDDAAEAQRRGWTIIDAIEDAGYSAKDLRRPGITRALEELRRGRADALVVAKLDRLSRSMIDFTGLMARATKESWALVALDVDVDTTTPAGEAMAHLMATFAQFERRLIGQRTREALAQKKAQGVQLGRPRELPAKVRARIKRRRSAGKSLAAIAEELNRDEVPTAHGGARWYASTVRAVLTAN